MAPSLTLKQYDTFPAWLLALQDENGWIPLSGAQGGVKFVGQIQGGTAMIGPTSTAPRSEVNFTATMTQGSPLLTGVSSVTGLTEGSTLTGGEIPAGTVVESFDPVGLTILMTNPAEAGGTNVAIIGNRGNTVYTPTSTDTSVPGMYFCECSIHWDVAGNNIQKVPNAKANNPQVQIDPSLLGTAGE